MGDCRQTVAMELRSKLKPLSWIFSFASCTYCSVQFLGHRTLSPHHCTALGVRTDDLLRRRRRQGLTKSQKTREVRAFVPCVTSIGTEEASRARKTYSSNNVPPQALRRCFSCLSFAVQLTRYGRKRDRLVHEKRIHLMPALVCSIPADPSMCLA